jgi:Type IV secretory pathway, VirD4 components
MELDAVDCCDHREWSPSATVREDLDVLYNRTVIALGAVLATLLLGYLLSSYLVLVFLGLDRGLFGPATYYEYVRALPLPQVTPFAGRIKAAGAVGFGVPALLALGALVLRYRPRKPGLHGDARFASAADLARHGLFKRTPDSLVVGRFGRRLVRLSGQQFAILAAPTRSGKGVGVVIPNLLEYQQSVVVLDIKQENFNLTSGWRASQGQEVFLFNPFAEDRRTHRWNPLSYVSDDPAFRVSDLMAIATMLYPDGADEQKFWVGQARNAFMAFALYLFENHDDERAIGFPGSGAPTLGGIHRLSTADGSDLRKYLQQLSSRPFLSAGARSAFASLLSQADETFASIMGTFKEPLNPWINPVLNAATSADDFRLTDLRRKRMTIYVGIQPNKLAEARLIINLFFSQVINLNTRELPQANPELRHQVLLLMDEFTAIGRVDIIASAVAYMAGYNIRLLPIIQSMAQLDATYGKDVSRTIITNHALQILYAPREQQDANDYSDMLGYTTVRRKNVTRGRETSYSYSEERRALMLPQELKAMGQEQEVFLYEGLSHPVKCSKIRYYKDRYFTSRLRAAVDVPPLQL